ncbi:MAG: hypothetical protein R2762_20675 [Bryobacteraceae bacterium]
MNLRIAVFLAIGLSGLSIHAQTPSYWLATVERTPTATTYTYNVKAPDFFVAWLLEANERGGGRPISKTVDGKKYTFVPQFFSWDTNGSAPVRTGQIRVDNSNNRLNGAWKSDQKLKSDQTLIGVLDSAATPSSPGSPWRQADLLALRWEGTGAPGLKYSEKISEIMQLRNKLASFNDGPTKPAAYFPSVQVPTNLDQVRSLMLAYGNAGRRDPDFRKNNGAKTATSLAPATVATLKNSAEKVNKDSPVPPYFKDLVMDSKLNEAAQLQAEYQASITRQGHDGPSRFKDPKSGSVVNLSGLGDRSKFFAGIYNVVEAAGYGALGDFPHRWMSGDTHFRPWFNVDKFYPSIGYGVAKGSDGNWYFAAVVSWEDKPSGSPTPSARATQPAPSVQPAPPVQPAQGDGFPLRAGTTFVQNRKYRSESGNHYLVFQPDGNVVVYTAANQFVWGLNTITPKFNQAKTVALQADGNLVVHGPNRVYIWSALTRNPDASAYLTLTPDGALRLVSGKTGATLWASR